MNSGERTATAIARPSKWPPVLMNIWVVISKEASTDSAAVIVAFRPILSAKEVIPRLLGPKV